MPTSTSSEGKRRSSKSTPTASGPTIFIFALRVNGRVMGNPKKLYLTLKAAKEALARLPEEVQEDVEIMKYAPWEAVA